MARQAKLVRYGVKPGKMDEFMAILKAHIAETRATEAGCIQFELLIPRDEKNSIQLYEVYADEDALDRHDASVQLAKYRSESAPLLTDRTIINCKVEG